MEADTVDSYKHEITAILLTNPATAADLNTALLAFDASLANERLKAAIKNATLSLLLSNTDSTLVNDALGLL